MWLHRWTMYKRWGPSTSPCGTPICTICFDFSLAWLVEVAHTCVLRVCFVSQLCWHLWLTCRWFCLWWQVYDRLLSFLIGYSLNVIFISLRLSTLFSYVYSCWWVDLVISTMWEFWRLVQLTNELNVMSKTLTQYNLSCISTVWIYRTCPECFC